MEDVLSVYERPYDAERPVVCLDESSRQLVGHFRDPLPQRPGSVAKEDYQYVRKGVANVFMIFEPLGCRRYTRVSERRTAVDFADTLKQISDELYPDVERIVLVLDNLNTHTTASLYKAFQPEEGRRLAERFEIHYTPTHGSWLDMARLR